jgi:very-short-patch-repair endonuclease
MSGCPFCWLGLRSRQEIELAFELKLFFDFDIDDREAIVDGHIEHCDIILRQHRLILEFDGHYWHKDKVLRDKEKTNILISDGWKVIRAREKPLQAISCNDVLVSVTKSMKAAAYVVLLKIQETLNIQLDGLDDYRQKIDLQNREASEAYIRRLRREKKPLEDLSQTKQGN